MVVLYLIAVYINDFLLWFCFSCCCHKVLVYMYLSLIMICEFVIIKLVVVHHAVFNEYFLGFQRR